MEFYFLLRVFGIGITNSIIRIEIAKTGFAAIISVTTYYEFLVMFQ